MILPHPISSFFFFNDTATTEIYTLSLHDALPISRKKPKLRAAPSFLASPARAGRQGTTKLERGRSEEHTSELQSHLNLVCRLLLEKKKKNMNSTTKRRQTSVITHTNAHPNTRHTN